ncbi:DUF115 domain-containing protein [Cohnella ginsengisoli]|uniref:DUF115 domain-containing protein n=1 Tax=Cohnella ginsengisoli TaxID=425004 RepID=A0A9X4KLU6_9BACL|nr:6-hydroxymethylpterin diphosphokinase MptE-like protein [Cohnella ginsengisoli]MDG0794577.1 DUF115 domain-containing protein [Cohnella ginsengisoli]
MFFLSALHVVDLGSLFSGLQVRGLAIGNDKNTINQFFYRFLRVMKGETATLALPVYDRLDLEARNSFNQIAKEAVLNYAYSQSLLQNAGLDWVRNIFYNLAVNLSTPSLNGLQGQLKGYPAIIVGAGPSLEEDIEVLKRMKHHAFIIAAGTSIQSLMHYGVEPHLIVTIDGGMPNYHAFSHLKLDDIPILYTPQVQHHIVENRTKNTIHSFLANDMITQVLMAVTQDEAVFASTHSVTGTAIQAAIFMGCEHIVFAGQDLSYPTEVVYASGAKHVDPGYAARIRQSADIQVDNVQGGKNQTTESMLLTLRDIEDLLSKHSNVRFTNTSSLGAQIQHAGFMPLNQIEEKLQANKLETTFFKELMQQHLFSYPELRINQSIDRINEMLGMLKLTKQRLDRIQKSLTKLSELSRSNPLKCLNLMVGIEEEWEPVVKSIVFHTLFMFGLKAEINAFDRHVSDIAEEKNTIRKAKLFKQVLEPLVVAMQGKIPVFEQIIAEAARRIDSRLERTGSGVTQ